MKNKKKPFRKKTASEVGQLARLACDLEVHAEKPGNVTPTYFFSDLTVADFLESSRILEPIVKRAVELGPDAPVCSLIEEAMREGKSNANFGILLLIIPLAAARGESTQDIIRNLDTGETKSLVRAMRKASLGGVKETKPPKDLSRYDVFSKGFFDVVDEEKITPFRLMELSVPYDSLAHEWIFDFPISRNIANNINPRNEESVVDEFLRVLASRPDTLIARKVGLKRAEEISGMATSVINGDLEISELDIYLRSEGNLLNPGTTADLIAAGLFLNLFYD